MTIPTYSKYIKPSFFPIFLCINSLALLYYTLPVPLQAYLALSSLLLLLLKALQPSFFQTSLIDSKDCSKRMMNRINIELVRFNWLVNRFTKQCLNFSLLCLGLFYLIDRYLHPSLSLLLALNLLVFYLCQTKHCRNWVKYRLGLFKEYNKYVIHIHEPSSPEGDSSLSQFLQQVKQI